VVVQWGADSWLGLMTLAGQSKVVVEETLVSQLADQGSQIVTLEIWVARQVFDDEKYFLDLTFFVKLSLARGCLGFEISSELLEPRTVVGWGVEMRALVLVWVLALVSTMTVRPGNQVLILLLHLV